MDPLGLEQQTRNVFGADLWQFKRPCHGQCPSKQVALDLYIADSRFSLTYIEDVVYYTWKHFIVGKYFKLIRRKQIQIISTVLRIGYRVVSFAWGTT
jgi:hypothetical protein